VGSQSALQHRPFSQEQADVKGVSGFNGPPRDESFRFLQQQVVPGWCGDPRRSFVANDLFFDNLAD
jgi:hypothetical protein